MKNLFNNVNMRITIAGIVLTEVVLIAFLLAFDLSFDGLSILGYVVWSLVIIISFPILLRQWMKEKNNNNND